MLRIRDVKIFSYVDKTRIPFIDGIWIETILPIGLPIESTTFYVKYGNSIIRIDLQHKHREDIQNYFFFLGGGINNIRITNDRLAQFSYLEAKFEIMFDNPKNISEIDKDMEMYVQDCIDIINKATKLYRSLYETYFHRTIIRRDLLGYKYHYLVGKHQVYVHGPEANIGPGTDDYFTNETIDNDQLRKINSLLSQDFSLNLFDELILNSKDLFKEKSYRMAIIEIETAVENVMASVITNFYRTKKTQNEIDFILKERIDGKKESLKPIFPSLLQSSIWTKWKNDCNKLRNDIVHANKTPSFKEAEAGIDAAIKLIEFFKEFLKIYYDYKQWIKEGVFFSLLKDNNNAICCFGKAIAKDPNNYLAYNNIGFVLAEKKNYQLAIKVYKKSLMVKEIPETWHYLGSIYEEDKQYEEAIKCYRNSINLNIVVDDEYYNPYYRIFTSLKSSREDLTEEDHKELISHFEKLLTHYPYQPDFLLKVGYSYYKLKDYSNGISSLSKAILIEPTNAWNFYYKACCEINVSSITSINDTLYDLENAVSLNRDIIKSIEKNKDFDILRKEKRFTELLKSNS
jgi:tetratricopeptide (TPR) repeat protein